MSASTPGALPGRRIALPLGSAALAERAREVALGMGALLASVLAGTAALDPRWGILVVATFGLSIMAGIAALSRGALVGLIALGVLNGIPGLDLESFAVRGSFQPRDFLIVFLLGALVLWRLTTTAERTIDGRWLTLVRVWSFVFVTWWLITLGRSVLFSDIPALKAALFGRDFLYFGLLLPLLPVAFRRRSDVVALVAVVGTGGTIFALAQIATSLFPSVSAVLDPSLFINATLTNEFEGVTRVYAYMGDVVVLGAILAGGTAILARSRQGRVVSSALFVVLAVGGLTQLSRAAYAAMAAGFLLVVLAALLRAAAPMGVVRRVLPALVLVVAFFLALSLIHPSDTDSQSAAQVFATRAESGIQEIQARSGTVGYRFDVQSEMFDLVGNRWPVGLGFWHPDARYVASFPEGSIRNRDVGVLNGIMTIGAIGTILLYLPVLGTIVFLVRRRRHAREWDGVVLGASGWLFGVVVASISLVTLFTVPGLVLTAVVIVAAVSVASRPDEGGVAVPERA